MNLLGRHCTFYGLLNTIHSSQDNLILILLLRILAIGLQAWDMIDSQMFREPKLDVHVVTKFLPALMSLIVDDQVRALNSRLPPDERESAITIIEHSGKPYTEQFEYSVSRGLYIYSCLVCSYLTNHIQALHQMHMLHIFKTMVFQQS